MYNRVVVGCRVKLCILLYYNSVTQIPARCFEVDNLKPTGRWRRFSDNKWDEIDEIKKCFYHVYLYTYYILVYYTTSVLSGAR